MGTGSETRQSNGDRDGSIPADEGAEVVRALIAASGRSLRALERHTNWSFQSWSAYQNGDRSIPVLAMRQLLTVTGVAVDSDLGRRAAALLAAHQSPPEDHTARTADPPAIAPSAQTAEEATRPAPLRRRGARWWGSAAAAVVIAVLALLLHTNRETGPADQNADDSTGSANAGNGGVPCRRTMSTAPEVSSGSAVPAAQSSPRPRAFAPGGAGHAELIAEQRHLLVVDGSGDWCSVIVTARADGAEVGPWANSSGKTGKVKDGVPVPPKVVELPWLDSVQRLEFRACFGEVVEGRIVFRESDCGAWAAFDRK